MPSLNPFTIYDNMKTAKEDFEASQSIVNLSDGSLYIYKEEARKSLRKLGKAKVKCFSETIPPLLNILSQINYEPDFEIKLRNSSFKMPALQTSPEFEAQCSIATSIASSAASGVAGGGVTAFAIYSGVGYLATASTGTAIANLSGIAAHNAILSWLGGGSLAAGGGGIKSGLRFLGIAALVAGAAIMTLQMSAKAEKARAEAETQVLKAWEHHDIQKLAIQKLGQLSKLAHLAYSILKRINKMALEDTSILMKALPEYGTNFENFPDSLQYTFYRGAVYVDILNTFSKIQIMNEDGELIDESETAFNEISKRLDVQAIEI